MTENKKGRPTKYSQELADKICEGISQGNSVRTICIEEDMPSPATVFSWLRTYPEFLENYERAQKERTIAMGEDILDIADDGVNDYMWVQYGKDEGSWKENKEVTNRSKLRVDTRKWLMSKMEPKKYGDKIDVTSDGKALPQPIYGGTSIKTEGHDSN